MDISLRHLHQIKALARQGNFAKAARDLNISQPALSRSIALLEDRLGVKLFDRSKRGVMPTVFGEHILQRGTPVLRDVQMMERDSYLLQGLESGKLVIGSGPVPAEISIGKAVALFHTNHPRINIQIIVDKTPNLLAKLRHRELDILIADTRMINDASELEITLFPQQQGYFYCRADHPLTAKKGLQLKDIFSYSLAVMWFPRALLDSLARKARLQLKNMSDLPCAVLQCDYLKVLFDIVAGSDAVGLTTRAILDNSNLQQQLVLLPISLRELNTHYGMVTLSRYAQSPVVTLFQQFMFEAEKQCCPTTEHT